MSARDRAVPVNPHADAVFAVLGGKVFHSADGEALVLTDDQIVSVDADGDTSSAEVGRWTDGYDA